jgi:ectoine hydroxylase-related dioxygenase (phytanoyl-CoA dioxygenase family)
MTTAFDRQTWIREGFLVTRSVLSDTVLEGLRAEADRLVASLSLDFDRSRAERLQTEGYAKEDFEYAGDPGEDIERQIRMIEPVVDISPVFQGIAYHEGVVSPARAVFDDDVSLFEDKLNLKLPGGAGFPWHQDWSCCWRAHTDELVTCFIYLDDSTEDNGCLKVVPRSHAGKGIRPFREGSEFAIQITDEDRERVTPLPLSAGDMIAFDPYLLHYSAPNRTHHPRRAIIYTYNPARLGDLWTGRYTEVTLAANGSG